MLLFNNQPQFPLHPVRKGSLQLCQQRHRRSCSAATRNWAGALHSYFVGDISNLHASNGVEGVRSTYSYSSTGSAFGWAIWATATDPPPNAFDCRARVSTSPKSTEEPQSLSSSNPQEYRSIQCRAVLWREGAGQQGFGESLEK